MSIFLYEYRELIDTKSTGSVTLAGQTYSAEITTKNEWKVSVDSNGNETRTLERKVLEYIYGSLYNATATTLDSGYVFLVKEFDALGGLRSASGEGWYSLETNDTNHKSMEAKQYTVSSFGPTLSTAIRREENYDWTRSTTDDISETIEIKVNPTAITVSVSTGPASVYPFDSAEKIRTTTMQSLPNGNRSMSSSVDGTCRATGWESRPVPG